MRRRMRLNLKKVGDTIKQIGILRYFEKFI